jgi:DNA adenine methylase
MPITPSPLRYPGGKTSLFGITEQILQSNQLSRATYAEPFAGGGGLALSLLYEGVVRRIVLNDIDSGIYSFWDGVLNHTEAFISLIERTPITMEEWHRERQIYLNAGNTNSLELGFATFFLNRTNRSGVIKGGVIGGQAQDGPYLLDCRFSKEALVNKVRRIARYRSSITIENADGEDFLKGMSSRADRLVHFIDPPYYRKAFDLYTNFYTPEDHKSLALTIAQLEQPWLLTYDFTPEIRALYPEFAQYAFDLNYSVAKKRVGTELLVTSDGIDVSSISRIRPLESLDRAGRAS